MEEEDHGLPVPWPDDAPYTASYCEENVYLLAAKLTHGTVYVIFVSNPNKSVSSIENIPHSLLFTAAHWSCQVVLFESRTAPEDTESRRFPVVWDYHVILLISNGSGALSRSQTWVYDFDSRLHKPCKLEGRHVDLLVGVRPHSACRVS